MTTDGSIAFFRRLDVGAEGEDVAQLNQTLAAAGYSPGASGQHFTQQTSFALAQWQAAHGYPAAAPSTSQAVQVALMQGAGYQLGDQTTAGLTIGPPPLVKAASTTASHTIIKAVARPTRGVGRWRSDAQHRRRRERGEQGRSRRRSWSTPTPPSARRCPPSR